MHRLSTKNLLPGDGFIIPCQDFWCNKDYYDVYIPLAKKWLWGDEIDKSFSFSSKFLIAIVVRKHQKDCSTCLLNETHGWLD